MKGWFRLRAGRRKFRLRARYFAHGGKVPKTPPGVPGPRERGEWLNWLFAGGGGFQAGLQNLAAGKPTPQTWQKYIAKRGILIRPLRGWQRQDGRRAPGYYAHRRRTGCGGLACGRDGVALPRGTGGHSPSQPHALKFCRPAQRAVRNPP